VAQYINAKILNWLLGVLNGMFGTTWQLQPDHWSGYLLAALVHCFLLLNVVAVGALIFIWMERKISGRIQDRLGPTRVGGRFGWLQTLADGIKLVAKEDITPGGADGMLFKLAPYISFAASYAAYLALPFADGWVAQYLSVAVFFILAVMGLEVFGVILAGYSSGSKWSLFGGMREAAQVVSYEVPMAMCVLVPVMIVGSMDLVKIANVQAGLFTNWLVFHDPFTFIVFWVYFTCAMASVNRAPFDLAEAESELVAGFHTEYSGLRWSIFFMAEYGSMFAVSGLAAILFFGGWHGPIPIFQVIGWSYEHIPGEAWRATGYLANFAGCLNFIFKAVVGVSVMMWVRWTLPRLRIDQVMTTCWKYCMPISAGCFILAAVWTVMDIPFVNDIAPAKPRFAVREFWLDQANHAAAREASKAAAEPAAPERAAPEKTAIEPRAQHEPTASLTQLPAVVGVAWQAAASEGGAP
jgi:NADH-quinone oxidoreductase subunit H